MVSFGPLTFVLTSVFRGGVGWELAKSFSDGCLDIILYQPIVILTKGLL
jgi:hypothetical protein